MEDFLKLLEQEDAERKRIEKEAKDSRPQKPEPVVIAPEEVDENAPAVIVLMEETNADDVPLTEYEPVVLTEITMDEAVQRVMDFTLSHEERVQAFEMIFQENDFETVSEYYFTISSQFLFAPVFEIMKFVEYISAFEKIPIQIRLDSITNLYYSEVFQSKACDILYGLLVNTETHEIPVALFMDKILLLLRVDSTEKIQDLFLSKIVKADIPPQTIYRFITAILSFSELFIRSSLLFVERFPFHRSTVLAISNVLEVTSETTPSVTDQRTALLDLLTRISDNPELEENHRFDALDTLYHFTQSAEIHEKILQLGQRNNGRQATIYTNSQNVHSSTVSESAISVLEWAEHWLLSADADGVSSSVVKVAEQIHETFGETCSDALDRISMDKKVFYKKYTIQMALETVWRFIHAYFPAETQQVLLSRMREELQEMTGTCSSGYIFRIANVLSGFIPCAVKISWEDEISAIVRHRMNKIVMAFEGCDQVLDDMTKEKFLDKQEYRKALRGKFGELHRELYVEYVGKGPYVDAEGGMREDGLISESDFDIFFRKAMIVYDGVEMD